MCEYLFLAWNNSQKLCRQSNVFFAMKYAFNAASNINAWSAILLLMCSRIFIENKRTNGILYFKKYQRCKTNERQEWNHCMHNRKCNRRNRMKLSIIDTAVTNSKHFVLHVTLFEWQMCAVCFATLTEKIPMLTQSD